MKKHWLLLFPAFLMLSSCTVRMGPPIPLPLPADEFRAGYNTFMGQVVTDNGAPVPNVRVTLEEKSLYDANRHEDRFMTVTTNNAGYFSFQVKRNRKGLIRINNELIAGEMIRFKGPSDATPFDVARQDFSVVLDAGTADRRSARVWPGRALRIRVAYNRMGAEFNRVERLYGDHNYGAAADEARSFLDDYGRGNSPYVAEIRRIAFDSEKNLNWKMRSEFNALMDLDRRGDYESVVSRGRDYIRQYRGVRDSRWEDIGDLVRHAEHHRHDAERYGRDDSYGRDDRYRNDERYGRGDERFGRGDVGRGDERSGRDSEAAAYDALRHLRNDDYGAIISQGRAYIDQYGGPGNSRSREVERMMSTAEARKKQSENRGLGRRFEPRDEEHARQNPPGEAVRNEAPGRQFAPGQAVRDEAHGNQNPPGEAVRNEAPGRQFAPGQAVRNEAHGNQNPPGQAVRNEAHGNQNPPGEAVRNEAPGRQFAPGQAVRNEAHGSQNPPGEAVRNEAPGRQSAPGQAMRNEAPAKRTPPGQIVRDEAPGKRLPPGQVVRNALLDHRNQKNSKGKPEKGKGKKGKAGKAKDDKGKGKDDKEKGK